MERNHKTNWASVEEKQKRKLIQEANREREDKKEFIKVMKAARKLQPKSNPGTSGQGFLPSDPNALCERLEFLMASKQTGNIVLLTEYVSICAERLRQKMLPHDAYKNLMRTLKK